MILSDTHLGRPDRGGRSPEALRPLWQGADALIINGDVAEVNDHTVRAEAARQVLRIEQYCEEDGVELQLLPGNHDPMISDIRQLELFDGEIFVTHGDMLHPAISPWNSNRDHLRELNEHALEVLPPESREAFAGRAAAVQFAAAQKWEQIARDGHPPQAKWERAMDTGLKTARVIWYWHTLPRRAADFAERHAPQARFFIFGHIHRSGIWEIRGRTIINTGSYDFPSRPHGVVIENHALSVWPIERDGERFRFADAPVGSYALRRKEAA